MAAVSKETTSSTSNESKETKRTSASSSSSSSVATGGDTGHHKYSNRLAKEKSPYLQQHAHNPVDWYPWGQEAFDKAKAENKVIFLSVGYSTCHWCHVMEHESFESESVALIMNKYFVNIKVDREERPDVDKVYMTYIQATQGGGGWPMSVFITPTLKPFFGGTYFPADGFRSILQRIHDTWMHQRTAIESSSDELMEQIREQLTSTKHAATDFDEIATTTMERGFTQCESQFDARLGGFGRKPKFPRPVIFNFLYRVYDAWKNGDEHKEGAVNALNMCTHTLDAMAAGGIHDHLAGGFHRYSTTNDWHIPHYEKMLYDQGQIANSYIDAYQITKLPLYERVARGILDYVSGPVMCHMDGAFFSAEDADSVPPVSRKMGIDKPGKKLEGAFFVWEFEEIVDLLGKENSDIFNWVYGVERKGNTPAGADPHGELTGQNTLIMRHTLKEAAHRFVMSEPELVTTLDHCKRILNEARNKRPRPHLDDKIITSWNGLMISAFARAAQVWSDDKYMNIATKAASFIESTLYNSDTGRLIRNYKDGPSSIEAFADDYAFLIMGLIDLYEASCDIKWLKWAIKLQAKQDELFWDKTSAGYFDSIAGDKHIIYRTKEDYDGSEPSPNSISALNLLRLGQMLARSEYTERSKQLILSFNERLTKQPFAVPQMAVAVDMFLRAPKQIVITLPSSTTPTTSSVSSVSSTSTSSTIPASESKSSAVSPSPSSSVTSLPLIRALHSKYSPNKVLIVIANDEAREWWSSQNSFYGSLPAKDGQPTAYLCQHYSCQLPTHDPTQLANALN